jgi:hypothetical protein
VQQRSSRSYSCISCLGTRDLLLFFYTEGLNMGGNTKISTPGPIKRAPPLRYFRSKVETLSGASPLLSGKMSTTPASSFLTLIPSSSTSLPPAYSKGVTTRGFTAVLILVLRLHQLVITVSYVHMMNHLMVMTTVHHGQISLATASVLMQLGRTP